MKSTKSSAADRTSPLFDPLDTTKVAGPVVELDGPTIHVVVLKPKPEHALTLRGGETTHYKLEYGSEGKTLCGDTLRRLADQGTRGKICEVCRIVASHLRAVVQ
jgi:hypothetical protein